MSRITIFRFCKYDIGTDEIQTSRRWGTREGIESIGGTPIKESAIEVDADVVRSNIPGLTERDFNPNQRSGFQTQVDR